MPLPHDGDAVVEVIGAVLTLGLDVDPVGVELEALLRGVNTDRQRRLFPCSHLYQMNKIRVWQYVRVCYLCVCGV